MDMEVVRCLRADVSGSRTESGKGLGRDTRMCGDPEHHVIQVKRLRHSPA